MDRITEDHELTDRDLAPGEAAQIQTELVRYHKPNQTERYGSDNVKLSVGGWTGFVFSRESPSEWRMYQLEIDGDDRYLENAGAGCDNRGMIVDNPDLIRILGS